MTHARSKPSKDVAAAEAALARHSLAYPGTIEENPWGHRAFKVNRKTFLFLWADANGLDVSTKLPESGQLALELPFAEPTGYGLGKSGWVSAHFAPGKKIPLAMLEEWIDESFRAIAPRKVVAALAANGSVATTKPSAMTKPSAKTKPPAKTKPSVKAKPRKKSPRVRKNKPGSSRKTR